MVSFTGSTRAGVHVAKNAADTVKRVHQGLGVKSPNVILEGAPLDKAIPAGLMGVLINSGQSCIAPTRVLVHKRQHEEAVAIEKQVMKETENGDPMEEGRHIGPLVHKNAREKEQGMKGKGLEEGGTGKVSVREQ